MPQQLVYTSSPRGLVVGRSGYCMVACSEGMREALQSRLEQISYFEHSTQAGARHADVFACRVVDIRGTRFHCLSRIVDAGLDFTKRTNFIAHHLVFSPEEVASLPPPPVIFLHWNCWRDTWSGDPEWLRAENWGNLFSLPLPALVPCGNWQRLTGDAANAVALLEGREAFLADGFDHQKALLLIAEALALHAARPGGGTAWDIPFTAFLQESDEAADFRCRLVYSGTPAHARLMAKGAALSPLRDARPKKVDEPTAACARSGLVILEQPKADQTAYQHDILTLAIKTTPGVAVTYQWHVCSQEGKLLEKIPEAVGPVLKYKLPRVEAGRYFCVVISSTAGRLQSRIAKVTVLPASKRDAESRTTSIASRTATKPAATVPPLSRHQPIVQAEPGVSFDLDEAAFVKEKEWNPFLLWGGIAVMVLTLLGFGGYLIYKEIRLAQNPDSATSTDVAGADNSNSNEISASTTMPDSSHVPTNSPRSEFQQPPKPSQLSERKAPSRANAIVWCPMKWDADTQKDLETKMQAKDDEIKNQKAIIEEKTRQIKEEKEPVKIETLKNERQSAHKSLDDATEMKKDTVRLLNSLGSNLGSEQKLIQATLTKQLTGLFPVPSGVKINWKVIDLVNRKEEGPGTCDGVFDVNIGGSQFNLAMTTNGVFGITKFEPVKNQLVNPILIIFSTNANPSDMPMAKLIVWPTTIECSAQCGADGKLKLDISQDIVSELDCLHDDGGYAVNLSASYARGYPGSCQTNYKAVSSPILFDQLAKRVAGWNEQWTTVSNLLILEDQAKKRSLGQPVVSTNIWQEVGRACELWLNRRLDYDNPAYDFEHNPNAAASTVLEELSHLNDVEEVDKDNFKEVFRADRIQNLEAFINEEGSVAVPSLNMAKERLLFYGGKLGVPLPQRLKAEVTLRMVGEESARTLLAFKFVSSAKNGKL